MSDPVVEELLEKGVHAGAVALANVANLPEWMQVRALGRDMAPIAQLAVEAAFDAVFPGWREGKLQFGLLAPNGNVHGPISNRVTAESAAFTNDRLVSRWVGPWVPVEEGTDG